MKVSVSILGLNDRKKAISLLNNTNCDYIHIDVMDGSFVPNKQFTTEEINNLEIISKKKFDVHLMVDNPREYIENLDISNCKLNTSNVDTSIVGTYDYFVVCGNLKYSAKVIVKEKTDEDEKVVLNLKNEFTYLVLDNSINVERLISSPNNYTFSFEDKENALNSLKSVGFKTLNIKAIDDNNNENIVTSFVYVIDSTPKMTFSCTSPDGSIIDKFVFDKNKNSMNASVRIKINTYDNDAEYDNMIKKINEGKLTINGEEGYALIDKENKQISLLSLLTNDILDKEYNSSFPTSYNEISNYYRNILKYNCSF